MLNIRFMKQTHIHIAIVEDHPIVIEGLKNMLVKEPDFVVTGTFGHEMALMEHLSTTQVEVILMDISLPDVNGLDLCKSIHLVYPDIVILILSNHIERSMIMESIQNGAKGYLLKSTSVEEIVKGIKETMNGQFVYSDEVKEIIAQPSRRDFQGRTPITKREKQILQMIADGKTSVQIAGELFLSSLTVDTHRKNMLQKFGVKNTAELIIEATRQAIL